MSDSLPSPYVLTDPALTSTPGGYRKLVEVQHKLCILLYDELCELAASLVHTIDAETGIPLAKVNALGHAHKYTISAIDELDIAMRHLALARRNKLEGEPSA